VITIQKIIEIPMLGHNPFAIKIGKDNRITDIAGEQFYTLDL